MSSLDPMTTALLTEHMSYTPITIIDEVINAANSLVYSTCEEIEEYFTSQPPSSLGFHPPSGQFAETDDAGNELFDEAAINQLREGFHQLETLLENGVDRAYDGMELWTLRNIFTVPADLRDWMLLGHHKGLIFQPPSEESPPTATLQSISHLRRQLQETTALHAFLSADISRDATIHASLTSLLHPSPENPHALAFLTAPSPSSLAIKPIPETAAFTVEQISTLRQLISKLKSSSDAIFPATSRNGGVVEMEVDEGGDGKEKARALYVEKMTRRHLEKARGLKLTAEGSLRSGDGGLDGARKSEAEAAALESLVGNFGDVGAR